MRVLVTNGVQTANAIFETNNNSTYTFLSKIRSRQIIPVKLLYRSFPSRADAAP